MADLDVLGPLILAPITGKNLFRYINDPSS